MVSGCPSAIRTAEHYKRRPLTEQALGCLNPELPPVRALPRAFAHAPTPDRCLESCLAPVTAACASSSPAPQTCAAPAAPRHAAAQNRAWAAPRPPWLPPRRRQRARRARRGGPPAAAPSLRAPRRRRLPALRAAACGGSTPLRRQSGELRSRSAARRRGRRRRPPTVPGRRCQRDLRRSTQGSAAPHAPRVPLFPGSWRQRRHEHALPAHRSPCRTVRRCVPAPAAAACSSRRRSCCSNSFELRQPWGGGLRRAAWTARRRRVRSRTAGRHSLGEMP